MSEKVTLGGGSSGQKTPNEAASASGKERGIRNRTEAPPILMVGVIVLLVVCLSVGGFYVYNGGWKTAAQQDETYKHEMLPQIAANRGDMAPLEAENKLRKSRGEAPLVLPPDRHQKAAESRAKLADLQKAIEAKRGTGTETQ